jgi:catechol 2,3-dioxygenase-like lactoylglutathione lyase family enzyme
MACLRLTHIGICVADLERSLRFYRDGLGFRLRSRLEIAGEPASTLLRLADVDLQALYLERDGTRIELLHYRAPGHLQGESPRPMNRLGLTHLSLRVDDLEATLAELQRAGARVLQDSRIDIPGFEAAAVLITDPDGTLVELVQSPGDLEAPPGMPE